MPTISDIMDKPTPIQAELGRDMAAFAGFGRVQTVSAGKQFQFMGGASRAFRFAGSRGIQAASLARQGVWGQASKVAGVASKAAWTGAKRSFLPGLGLYFMASSAVTGFKEGGVIGAATGVTKEAAMWGAGTLAVRGIGGVLGAAGVGLSAGGLAIGGAYLATAAAAGGLAYGAYKGAEASWQYHMKSLPLETAGSTVAFQTSGAATMRQRSIMNIQRSHLNARSAFGNEAQFAHIARYRGVGRRGLM
jgi:hypothetical protein